MKEIFIERYKHAIREYFDYPGCSGEGHRERLYILNEYEKILEEVFNMSHKETKKIFEKLYEEAYVCKAN